MPSHAARAIGLVLLVAVAGGCGGDDGDDSGGDEPVTAPAIVTFEVAGEEEFKVELVTQELVDHALQLLGGADVASIPIGVVVRDDPGVNEPWSWHLDPATVEFADATIEVCDGLPSFVEDGTVTSDSYCPWSATVIAVEPA